MISFGLMATSALAQTAGETAPSANDMVTLDAPNPKGSTLKLDKTIKQVKLKQKSKTGNEITDVAPWFDNNQLKLPYLFNTVEPYIPKTIPNAYKTKDVPSQYQALNGIPVMYAFDYGDVQLYSYGNLYYKVITLQVVKDNKVISKLDFSKFVVMPDYYVAWAIVEGDILYIQHGVNGSAKQNAYLSAISLKENKILWTTKPLISDVRNFVLSGDSIITGYGNSGEPDFLYVLDKHSGDVVQKIKLKTGPEFIIEKDNDIYVRTYSEDYVFSMSN